MTLAWRAAAGSIEQGATWTGPMPRRLPRHRQATTPYGRVFGRAPHDLWSAPAVLPIAGSFAEWTRLAEVVRWPLVAVAVLLFIWSDRGRRLLVPILRRVRKLTGAGFALELTEEAASRTKADVEGALDEYERALNVELARLAHQHDVRAGLKLLVDRVFPESIRPAGLRATVYIWDPLLADHVVQLVGYYPGRAKGAGRRFPSRFGMVGLAFRSQEAQYKPSVPDDAKTLIAEWGMDDEQAAEAGSGKKCFLCEILRRDYQFVGVLYLDATHEGAFDNLMISTAQGNRTVLSGRIEFKELARRVRLVRDEVAKLGPALNLTSTS